MTAEEIKAANSMADVVGMYGYKPNRQGFICCPFHTEKTASMKIYKDSFHCFGCGKSGDIFTFVQMVEQCNFKEAFKRLGGGYEKRSDLAKIKLYRIKQEQAQRKTHEEEFCNALDRNCYLLGLYRAVLKKVPPMSQAWADLMMKLEYQEYLNWYYLEHWNELREGKLPDGFSYSK